MSINNTLDILQRVDDLVLVPMQGPIDDELLENVCDSVLFYLKTRKVEGIIFDMGGIEVMDEYDFTKMKQMVDTISLMGVKVVLAAIRPGVAAGLAMLDADISWPQSSRTVKIAMEMLR